MVGNTHYPHRHLVTPSLYNPHNYRLYFNFTKEKYQPKEGMVGVWFGKFKNYKKEFTSTGEEIRVTIKKTKAEIINKLSEQEWFVIQRSRAKEEILSILNQINVKCINSFKRFMEVYGGNSDLIILNRENVANLILNTKCDNKVMKEPFIDSLPLPLTFETKVVKKVYKQPNVEFKEPIYAAHYLENSALNEFNPEIAEYLGLILENNKLLVEQNVSTSKIMNDFAINIKTHTKAIKEMVGSLKKFNKLLSERQRRLNDFI